MPERAQSSWFTEGAAFAVVAAGLYIGRDLLVPLAMAILLSFLLSPVLARLERSAIPRPVSIVLVLLVMATLFGVVAWYIAQQLGELFARIPDFRVHIAEKLHSLRGPLRSLADAMGWMEQLTHEVEPSPGASRTPKVEVVERPNWFGMIGYVVSPVLGPLGTAGLVGVLTLFILFEREDLRSRLIRLLRAGDHPFTARALDEASERVSRYLGRQALLCTVHGCALALGLALIGLPGAGLFGVLSGASRVIPYLGPSVAAALPIALSVAGFPGWSMALYTVALYAAVELITNNVLEPWMYGAGAGLTAFGVVFAAVFWAWLWGGVGLFLAIPITVCCVVLGRYIPQLSLFTTLFGDEPVAAPAERLYERLTWRESADAAAILAEGPEDPVAFSDALVLPVLARLASDLDRRRFSREHGAEMIALLSSVLDHAAQRLAASQPLRSTRRVFLPAAAADPVEELARSWTTRVLRQVGFAAELGGRASAANAGKPGLAVEVLEPIAVLPALTRKSLARARVRALRLAGVTSPERVVLAAWTQTDAPRSESGIALVRSCAELVEHLIASTGEARPPDPEPEPDGTALAPLPDSGRSDTMAGKNRAQQDPKDSSEPVPESPQELAYDEGRTSCAQPDAASARAESLAGRGPKNFRRSDQRIFQAVCQALEDHPGIDASEIEVSCESGEVTLSGSVLDARSAELAVSCASAMPGILGVRSELKEREARGERGAPAKTDSSAPAETGTHNHVLEASEDSFPASDAPAWSSATRIGGPLRPR